MKQYMVLKRFTLKDKVFIKDSTFSSKSMRSDVVKRLIAGGYIRATMTMDVEYEEEASYESVEDFLTPTEVNRLKLDDLMKYAKQIGVEKDFGTKTKITDLRKLVNNFIAKNSEDEDDTEGDDFLTPDEIAKLSFQQLSEYAVEIGMDFASDITEADLATLVNDFISKALQESDDNA